MAVDDMEIPIITIRIRYRLFRHPKRIGDIIEMDGKPYLVIGINKFHLWGYHLTVWYTCQDLTKVHYPDGDKIFTPEEHWTEAHVCCKYDDKGLEEAAELGRVYGIDGQYYKTVEYSDIEIIGTDIDISFYAKPIFPISRKEARSKLFDERRKKLKIELV